MNYEHSKNETETLSADDERLREMCRTLKKVEAPKDFDFKLKARIANANPTDFEPRFGFAFRYALPALFLIFVFALLAYNGGFLSSNDKPAVADGSINPANPALPQNTTVSSLSTPEPNPNANAAVLPANSEMPKVIETAVNVTKPKRSDIEKKSKLKNDGFNGSALKSFKPAPVFQPKEFEQKPILQNIQPDEKANPISVKDVLSINGINADFENGKWKVKSVTANSVGENSGLKANDVIESIDEQPLSAETSFNKAVNGKTVTVTRNGEKLQIKLRGLQ